MLLTFGSDFNQPVDAGPVCWSLVSTSSLDRWQGLLASQIRTVGEGSTEPIVVPFPTTFGWHVIQPPLISWSNLTAL